MEQLIIPDLICFVPVFLTRMFEQLESVVVKLLICIVLKTRSNFVEGDAQDLHEGGLSLELKVISTLPLSPDAFDGRWDYASSINCFCIIDLSVEKGESQ